MNLYNLHSNPKTLKFYDDLYSKIYGDRIRTKNEFGAIHSHSDRPASVSFHPVFLLKWYKDGVLHRDNDLPAVIDEEYGLYWYRRAQPHRDGGNPAIIFSDGTTRYFDNGAEYKSGRISVEEYKKLYNYYVNQAKGKR